MKKKKRRVRGTERGRVIRERNKEKERERKRGRERKREKD